MFRPVRMKKVDLISTEEYKDKIIRTLHRRGVVQIKEMGNKLGEEEWSTILDSHPSDPNLRTMNNDIGSLNKILETFEEANPEEKDGFFKALFNPSPPKKIPVGDLHGKELMIEVGKVLERVKSEIDEPMEKINGIDKRVESIDAFLEDIKRISTLNVDISLLIGGYYTSTFVGIASADILERIEKETKDITKKIYIYDQKIPETEDHILVIVCLKEYFDSISNTLRRTGFDRINIEFEDVEIRGTPLEVIAQLESAKNKLIDERCGYEKVIAEAADKHRDDLEQILELMIFERERTEVKTNFLKTEETFVAEGWIPADRADKLREELINDVNGRIHFHTSDPDPSDDVPVKLNNKGFFKSFELITKLFSTPKYDEYDPTVLLSIGFMIFFALMLTDAMYGFVNLLLGLFLWKGGGKYNKMYKDFGIIFTACGVVSVAIGAITGGWFGDLFVKYLGINALNSVLLFEPMGSAGWLCEVTGQQGIILFLVISLLLGIIHLDTGILTGIIGNLKKEKIKDAFTGDLWFLLIQPAIVLLYFNSASYYLISALILILVAFVLLLVGHKGMFFFQITGALGDVLSYVRLMALGLCTYGMALTFNALAALAGGIPTIGIVFAVLIGLMGHILNWLLQTLGSFVHGMRLHYVEFFSKFYEGGGVEFTPFKENREKTVLK